MMFPSNFCDFIYLLFQSLSHVRLFLTPWTVAPQASLFFTISLRLLKLMSIESMMRSKHLILCHSLLLLPSIFPASRSFPVNWLFTSGGQSIGASASVLLVNIQDWFPLGLAVQGTLKSLIQHHRSKVSILYIMALVNFYFSILISYRLKCVCVYTSAIVL